jgi:hypothetical protein
MSSTVFLLNTNILNAPSDLFSNYRFKTYIN